MYDSYFQTCATLLVCRPDTDVFYLYLIIHTSVVIWRSHRLRNCGPTVRQYDTMVTTRSYSLLSNYLIFRATEIVEQLPLCRTIELSDHNYALKYTGIRFSFYILLMSKYWYLLYDQAFFVINESQSFMVVKLKSLISVLFVMAGRK